ncbi:MAG: ATP-grasp domain-containing protein [Lachnospiraceae bacterium]|nr:ATP-grasp domain-containing protein [Lachnospiraceae bacterium]
MKALIIGASEEALHTIEKAKEQGLTVVCMDGNPDAAGLKQADEAIVVNISNEEDTIAAARKVEPDFLLTVPIGRYLTTTGAVNEDLDLPGIGKEAAVNCTDKWKFHRLLEEKGLRKGRCILLTSWEEDGEGHVLEDFPYPAVLKPRFGSGSRGILVVENGEEAKKAIEEIRDGDEEDYLLEECVEGEEYGIDGAVIRGKFYLILLRKKENTPFPARQAVAYFSVLPTDEFYGQVEAYLKQVVSTLNLEECLLHGDIIRTGQGPFLIELSARPSGHNLHNLFTPLATGVDMAGEYIAYRMGKSCSFTPSCTRKLMIHYFDLEGEVKRVPSSEEVEALAIKKGCRLIQWECKIKPGEILKKVCDGHSLMGRGYYILEESTETEGEEGFKQLADEIRKLTIRIN